MKRIFIILVCICSCQLVFSQRPDFENQSRSNNTSSKEPTQRDSTTIVDNTFFDIFYGNPGRAAFYGLVIPGGGQIYNKKWWKLPFVYAIEGGTVYWIYLSTTEYNSFQNAYIMNLKDSTLPADVRGIRDVNLLKSNRDKWRKQREYSWIIFIGGHLITIFEAFIDRHLMEFDVSDDLSLVPVPSVIGPIPGITYTHALNKKKNTKFKNFWID